MLFDSGRNRLYVANTFSDSISVIQRSAVVAEVKLGPKPPLTSADRGELLFYDAQLSRDAWLSCHSCHTDGHSNGGLADTLGDGSYGAPKRVLSLLGVAETGPWAWDGSVAHLGQQLQKSVRTTLRGEPLSEQKIDELAAFLKTLPPAPPIVSHTERRKSTQLQRSIHRGRAIFERQRCACCHQPSLAYTQREAYNVGLADELGKRSFNPPSLRGVGQRAAYFHDNQTQTLKDVFTVHDHQIQDELSWQEVQDLVHFLESL